MSRKRIAAAVILAAVLAGGRLVARTPERAETVTGTVAKIEASERAVTLALADGTQSRFLWTNDTKFSGVLAPGAKVTIRYGVSSDGKNLAQQISVSRN